MALLTKQLVDEQLIDSKAALENLSSKYNINTMKNQIKTQIENLKAKEQLFLKAVGASSIQQVNERIKAYKKALPKIQNLSGTELYWSFLNSIESSAEYLANEKQRQFVDYFSQIPNLNEIFEEQDFAHVFQSLLNSIDIPGAVRITSGYSGATSFEQIVYKRLTEAQKRRVNQFLSGKVKLKQKFSNLDKILVQNNNTNVSVTYSQADWATLTNGQKESEIKNMLDSGLLTQKQLDNMLRSLCQLILSKGPSEDINFRKAVYEVIFEKTSKTKVFYGGNMMNGITGLLGEIQALFFMKSLLQNVGTDASIEWIGGIYNPHEDLILNYMGEKIGIQVKNAYKNIENAGKMENISFMTKAALNFEEIKNIMGADYNQILSIYEMDAFNIEYQTKMEDGERKYYAAQNDIFAPSRQNIETLSQQADHIMALFAGALMYMQTGEEFSGLEVGNSVYFLGGAVMKFASEILTSIFTKLESLEQDIGLKISSYFNRGKSGVGNIVEYFNSNQHNRNNSVTGALGQLFLSSSYTFTL